MVIWSWRLKKKRVGGPGDFDSWGHLESKIFNDSQSIDMSFWPELQLLNFIEK